jgi:DNA modification methylase
MTKKRIVLETSDEAKSALVQNADLQGETVSDWFHEQLSVAVPEVQRSILDTPADIANPSTLLDYPNVVNGLQQADWAFTNDDTRYLTHDLHPYPAKYIPQIPANLIARLSVRGDLVLDPFGGSGTTAVEAVRMGRRALSLDANPLASLIGRVKTGFMTSDTRIDIEQLLATVEGHLIHPDASNSVWGEQLSARFHNHIPDIPNIEKWFSKTVIGELALVRHLIDKTTTTLAKDVALLALSRIVIRVSFQDSETRYVSVPKDISPTFTLSAYLEALRTLLRRLESATLNFQYADARFITGDCRYDLVSSVGENNIDLVVTSPPYPNATDYHLYNRFRLFWLGYDPRLLGNIEIGSHLRHQRNGSGFEEYEHDMQMNLEECFQVLQPGRYAVYVVGDALFKGKLFSTSDALSTIAKASGFDVVSVISRPIHETKRSFAKPARRARSEQLLVLQKPNNTVQVLVNPPSYKMWHFEEKLRRLETERLTNAPAIHQPSTSPFTLSLCQPALWNIRRLTFSRDFVIGNSQDNTQDTWQKVLENGDSTASRRKDPKYVTHGIHPFKGKFYPQLAKSLLNYSGAPLGSRVLDPFCGSGTFLLEAMLNGFSAYGCDLNPLAAKIARAKTSILCVPRNITELAIRSLLDRLASDSLSIPDTLDHFSESNLDELQRWFPHPVLPKISWLLGQSRLFGEPALVNFFEVIVSSIIREISHQDPTDLRIRRRKDPLTDAPVFDLFRERLQVQYHRLQKYWSVAGRQPGLVVPPSVMQGDSRQPETFAGLGLSSESVDCIVTSPPYATALPYIDTDRLSLLAIMGIPSPKRSELEKSLTGSREIAKSARLALEAELNAPSAVDLLPNRVLSSIRQIHQANSVESVGFRRANVAALLWRYFIAMRENLLQTSLIMKNGANAFYIVGDSRTKAGNKWMTIETCKHIASLGEMVGLRCVDKISIDVTTENYKHIKNAITENQIIIFEKV